MPSTQELTRRIKSIKSTRKVTRAMQMVSASKMRKAQAAALASRKYLEEAERIMDSISPVVPTEGFTDGMTKQKDAAGKTLVILISSNRGLVGSFNSNVFAYVRRMEQGLVALGTQVEYVTMGKKVSEGTARLGKSLAADFEKPEGTAQAADIYALADLVSQKFESGEYLDVWVVYNHFVSTLSQKVVAKKILSQDDAPEAGETGSLYTAYEPSQHSVLHSLLPRVLESRLLQALLESNAGEHSARMVMMKNATEAAGDLVADLTLTANQLRQNKITTELSEITAGRIALE